VSSARGFAADPFDLSHRVLESSCVSAPEGLGLSKAVPKFTQLVNGIDFYKEGDKVVFTSVYHLKRGYCCHSKCRHCPYGLGVAQVVRIDIQGLSGITSSPAPIDPTKPDEES
jgi:hypothetical protein